MSVKVDHVVTTIMESHNIDTLSVVELQESIQSHVNKILEKTEKVNEEALKSQVNFNNVNECNQMGEGRSCDNLNYGGRGNFRGRGQEPLEEEDMETSIKRENNLNNFNPRGGNNFGSINW